MEAEFEIEVITSEGNSAVFRNVMLKKNVLSSNGISLDIKGGHPCSVTFTCEDTSEIIKHIFYRLTVPLKNFHEVIIPDTGRSYSMSTQTVNFWGSNQLSCINNIRFPLFIFTGMDLYLAMAFGIIGDNYETEFTCLEPTKNRALIAWMKQLTLEIKRGTDDYPVPSSTSLKNEDSSITEHIFFTDAQISPQQPWLLTLREFAHFQKELLDLESKSFNAAMEPFWCSWTDWFSDDVNDVVIFDNVKEGVKLGIKNFIIDDGWFGPGLDNDYNVDLNIGDWEPDPKKIPDMKKLIEDIKSEGARPVIWCAPHAVAPRADCFKKRRKYLIKDKGNSLLMTYNKFHSLCFMCPEARNIMADICAGFITKWDMDGAKYDLFNCVSEAPCCSKDHLHDTDSMIEGLTKTLELIDKKCRKLKKDYIVELKQNYGTPFLMKYGSVMRAGDTPYCPEGNFMRTAYVQAYTPYAMNDYQTITNSDSPEDTACVIIKMISVGIPAYSINFKELDINNKQVIKHYNEWYLEKTKDFMKSRIPIDGALTTWVIDTKNKVIFFLVNNAKIVQCSGEKPTVILNASSSQEIAIRRKAPSKDAVAVMMDCFGQVVATKKLSPKLLDILNIPRGGMCTITP